MTMPPSASSDYIVHDDGCCSPRFIRPTLNHIPATSELATQCGIPLAVIINPLAPVHEAEEPVYQVDFGEDGPIRCTRCKAYINSFVRFIQSGKKFVCNICGMHNETTREYYCNIDENGRRRDVLDRAELSKGSVEFLVPVAYTIRPVQRPIYLFVLDVSVFAVQNGLLTAALTAIKDCLYKTPTPDRAQFGLITFDKSVHYYTMEEGSETISILSIADIDDPFAPVPPSSWLTSDVVALERVCDLIETLYANTQIAEACTGSALSSACDALADSGGRVLLLHTSLARIGVGKITREETQRNYGTEHEQAMYTVDPKDTFYSQLADSCATKQIVVDLFCTGKLYADVATVSQICIKTGGSLHLSPFFGNQPEQDALQLQRQLDRCLNSTLGFEAVLKIRTSTGLRVKTHYGHFTDRSGGLDVELAGVDVDKSIVVELEHEDDLKEGSDVFIQAALLYTTLDGKRCVRVHNLALQVAPLLSNVFRYADLQATCCMYQRQASTWIRELTCVQTRDRLIENCVNVLYNYRKYCATASSSGQLILPESLKLLPLYTLATLKSCAVRTNLSGGRGGIDVRADERAVMLYLFESLPVEHAVFAVYPRLYALHSMGEDCGTILPNGKVQLPAQLPPTAERLTEDGVFLLVTAMSLQLYIAPNAAPELLLSLFGTAEVDTTEKSLHLVQQSELGKRVETMLEFVRESSPISQNLEILTKKDWRTERFMNALVEDRTKNDMSYVEFLCQIHKKIQTKFH